MSRHMALRWRRLPLALAAAMAFVLSVESSPASAQLPPAAGEDAGAQAVALAREGVALYEAGKWEEAEKKFVAAETKLHSPVFVLYIARAQRSTNRWLEARATLRKLAVETLPAEAPPPWKQALADARAELAAIEPTIPSIVVVAADAPAGATVIVDGKTAATGAPIELDPGKHRVVVRAGADERSVEVDLRSGDRAHRVEIAWNEQAAKPSSTIATPTRERAGGSVVPGVVVLGLGIAGLGVGGVTGVMALGASGDVQDACPDGVCPAGSEADVGDDQSRAGTLADVSTISFIAGGVVAAAGIVLIVVRPFGGDDTAVTASPRGLSLRGSF
jgi:hypothetical protein